MATKRLKKWFKKELEACNDQANRGFGGEVTGEYILAAAIKNGDIEIPEWADYSTINTHTIRIWDSKKGSYEFGFIDIN